MGDSGRALPVYALEFGGEDDRFGACEAAAALGAFGEPVEVSRPAPGLGLVETIDEERVRGLAYTHRASRVLGSCSADPERARETLAATALETEGTVAVRARDVRRTTGIDSQRVERLLGGVLTDRGFSVDLDEPDNELRALFAGDTCLLGWLEAHSRRDFGSRAPTTKPFFQPGSMEPLLARAIANIAGARGGKRLLDPMCGTAGSLIEAGLVGAEVLGSDTQEKMVRGAKRNLEAYLGSASVFRADARRLPLAEGAVDAVVVDLPYGRQSAIEGDLDTVVTGVLGESRRLADRAVVVADRTWAETARAAGWRIEERFERRVHRSLVRHILVLD